MSTGWDPYFDEGETLLWEGAPSDKLFLLRASDAFLIPFSLLWGGFALIWNVGVWVMGAPILFNLFGLPFLLIGVYIVIGRFFHDQFHRRHTVYALSTKRAWIATRAFGRHLRDMPINKDTQVAYTQGNLSTLILGTPHRARGDMRGFGVGNSRYGPFTFRALTDGAHVHRLIREIQGRTT